MTTSVSGTRSDHVARLVRLLRQQRGWTAIELAERCAAAGRPDITRSVIANIETGRKDPHGQRRRDVTVDELVVLAAVLDVSANDLLFGKVTVTTESGSQ